MNENNFILGENVVFTIYEYDEDNNEKSKEIKGKVYFKNNSFVTIDNGYYKESYKYCQMNKIKEKDTIGDSYDLSLETYQEDIVENCIEDVLKGKEGFVFNYEELNQVIKRIKSVKFITREEDNIFYIKII